MLHACRARTHCAHAARMPRSSHAAHMLHADTELLRCAHAACRRRASTLHARCPRAACTRHTQFYLPCAPTNQHAAHTMAARRLRCMYAASNTAACRTRVGQKQKCCAHAVRMLHARCLVYTRCTACLHVHIPRARCTHAANILHGCCVYAACALSHTPRAALTLDACCMYTPRTLQSTAPTTSTYGLYSYGLLQPAASITSTYVVMAYVVMAYIGMVCCSQRHQSPRPM